MFFLAGRSIQFSVFAISSYGERNMFRPLCLLLPLQDGHETIIHSDPILRRHLVTLGLIFFAFIRSPFLETAEKQCLSLSRLSLGSKPPHPYAISLLPFWPLVHQRVYIFYRGCTPAPLPFSFVFHVPIISHHHHLLFSVQRWGLKHSHRIFSKLFFALGFSKDLPGNRFPPYRPDLTCARDLFSALE